MSNFVVSARKYRPVRFDEVVGQSHVSQTLKNALQNDHLAHAFLFCGPRGVGKTTCARILAKVLNCQNLGKDHEPCNECNSCKSFNENASFNIVELDGASNNSVDHIRALIEQVRFQPQQGKYKIFIIDEVHMLSQSAFNAFLKTLEEPPPYAIFILATTEKHKIIPTILSRCQIFDFHRITIPATIAHLEEICKVEKIKAEPDALHIIAQKADGALRDALSIFDRMVSFSAKEITYQDVITNLNVLDYDYFFKVVDALLEEDMATVLNIFDDVQKKGFEGDSFVNGLADHIRNLLVCQDQQTLALLEVGEKLKARYKKQSAIAPTNLLLTALDIAHDCDVNYKMARNKRLHLEIALIKMAYINRVRKAKPMAAPEPGQSVTVAQKRTNEPIEATMPIAPKSSPAPQPISKVEESKPEPIKAPKKAAPPRPQPKGKINIEEKHTLAKIPDLSSLQASMKTSMNVEAESESAALDLDAVKAAWAEYAETVSSPSVRNMLKRAVVSIGDDQIIVKVGSKMSKDLLQQEMDLMPHIRGKLGKRKLAMNVELDANQVVAEPTSKPKKILSAKEKYEKMREVNPLIDDLRKKFDLRPDGD